VLTLSQENANNKKLAELDAIALPTARLIVAELAAAGFDAIITWAFRSDTVQGKIVKGTHAAAGWSFHGFRLALDFGILVGGKYVTDGRHPGYLKMGEIGKKHGWTWGGNWDHIDPDHIEYHPGENPHEAIRRVRKENGYA